MERKYSSDDVIRFLYGEMSQDEQALFMDALVEDETLFEELEQLKAAQQSLVKLDLQPSKSASERVLQVARRAARDQQRRRNTQFISTGKERILNFHHLVSVAMVLFTCVTVGAAVIAYQRATDPKSKWEMTETRVQWDDRDLDDRLDFAKERLSGMMENRGEAVVNVHHDTYRLVSTDLFAPSNESVVFLNIK
jgi:hypothetical protein